MPNLQQNAQHSLFNSASSYGSLSKFFHWVIATLVLLMLFFGYGIGFIPDKVLKGAALNAHKLTGLTILSLMLLRLFWRGISLQPHSVNSPGWQRFTEKSVHFLLYAVLLLMPIAGWVGSVAAGYPPRLGKIALNLPLPQST